MVEQRITISTTKTPENIPFKKDIPTIASPKNRTFETPIFYNPCFGGIQLNRYTNVSYTKETRCVTIIWSSGVENVTCMM